MSFSIPPSGKPDESRGPLLIGLTTPLALLALGVFGLRIYTRLRPVFRLSWDDYAMMAAVACGIPLYVFLILSVQNGVGRHLEYVFNINHLMVLGKLGFATSVLWGWGVTFVKLSVGLMMLRINLGKPWMWAMRGITAFVLVLAIVTMILQLTQCRPIEANWNPILPGAKCRSKETYNNIIITSSSLVIVTDVIYSCLPLTFIVRLQRPLRERIVLAFLLALGLFASATGIAKLILFSHTTNSIDPTWDDALVYFWSLAELYVGVFAACIPCLKAFMEKVLRRLGASISSKMRSKESGAESSRGAANSASKDPSTIGVRSSHQMKSFSHAQEPESMGSKECILHTETEADAEEV